jgi:F0F1-type ATP synthase epsilon subunit
MANLICNITSPSYNITLENVYNVKAKLTSGDIEILQNHQELMGRIVNNLLVIRMKGEPNIIEGDFLTYTYVIQEGDIFVTKDYSGIDTIITVIATNLKIIDSKLSAEDLKKTIALQEFRLSPKIKIEEPMKSPNDLNIGQHISRTYSEFEIQLIKDEIEFLKVCLAQVQAQSRKSI